MTRVGGGSLAVAVLAAACGGRAEPAPLRPLAPLPLVGRATRPDAGAPPAPERAADPHEPPRPQLPILRCSPDGAATGSALAPSAVEGASLGVATRFPTDTRTGNQLSALWTYEEKFPRAIAYGWRIDRHGAGVSGVWVWGPVASPLAARRDVDFLAPFDPAGTVRHASYTLRDLVIAARPLGLAVDLLAEASFMDFESVASVTPLLPADPNELVFASASARMLGRIGGGKAPRVQLTTRAEADLSRVSSAVALDAGHIAALFVDTVSGVHAFKLGGDRITPLFDLEAPLPRPPRDAHGRDDDKIALRNPDALAVNELGELGVLRTPSWDEPASAAEPAVIVQPNAQEVVALAPWTTLALASSPDCAANRAGWRVTFRTYAPWVSLDARPFARQTSAYADQAMYARVRWSASRVCLEGLSMRLQPATLEDAKLVPRDEAYVRQSAPLCEVWLVARFAAPATASLVGVNRGVEVRQPARCALEGVRPGEPGTASTRGD